MNNHEFFKLYDAFEENSIKIDALVQSVMRDRSLSSVLKNYIRVIARDCKHNMGELWHSVQSQKYIMIPTVAQNPEELFDHINQIYQENLCKIESITNSQKEAA